MGLGTEDSLQLMGLLTLKVQGRQMVTCMQHHRKGDESGKCVSTPPPYRFVPDHVHKNVTNQLVHKE